MTSLSELATKLRKRFPLVEPFQDVLEAADRLDAIQRAWEAVEANTIAGRMLDFRDAYGQLRRAIEGEP